MTESQAPYHVHFKEPIEGVIVEQNCEHCGRSLGLAVKKEDGTLFPLGGGEKVGVIGRETFGYTIDDTPFEIRTPSISYQGSA